MNNHHCIIEKFTSALILFICLFTLSCIRSQSLRAEKRNVKELRKYPLKLQAVYSNQSLSTNILNIRNSGQFDLKESFGGFSEYYVGKWIENNDTIRLIYLSDNHKPDCIDYIILEEKENQVKVWGERIDCSEWFWKIIVDFLTIVDIKISEVVVIFNY